MPTRKAHCIADDVVYLGPLAYAFVESGLSANELAMRLGWYYGSTRSKGDGTRVLRQLGLRTTGGEFRRYCSYQRAVELCRALELDPVDVGV